MFNEYRKKTKDQMIEQEKAMDLIKNELKDKIATSMARYEERV